MIVVLFAWVLCLTIGLTMIVVFTKKLMLEWILNFETRLCISITNTEFLSLVGHNYSFFCEFSSMQTHHNHHYYYELLVIVAYK